MFFSPAYRWIPFLRAIVPASAAFCPWGPHGLRASEAPAEGQRGVITAEAGVQANDLRPFHLSSCLFIPTLSTVLGTSTEYSVSGGIGAGRCFPGLAC